MRKLILLFISATMVLTSCSNDDNASSQDPLIGSWTSFQSFYNGTEFPLDDCDKMDTITVSANGTFTEAFFYDNGSTCESDGTDNGLWENQGNSTYKITYEVGTVDEEVLIVAITFNSNKFTVVTTDGSDKYTEVYIRS